MSTVDLIQRKRDGEELSQEEIDSLVDAYTSGDLPDYQMSALLMAVFFSGMDDREVDALTARLIQSGETIDLSGIPGAKVDQHSTGGVGDKAALIAAPLAAAAGVIVPMVPGRAREQFGGTLDKLEAIPGFRTNLSVDEFKAQLSAHGFAIMAQPEQVAPAEARLFALRAASGTVEAAPLMAASIMARKVAEGADGVVLDVKVGSGGHMHKQLHARRMAQAMVTVGRRLNKRVQALITDMNQPLGFAIGNALEIMEVSQTLQNVGPADLTRLALELAGRMIFVAKITATLEEGRELAQAKLLDGSGYRKLKDVIQAQGGDPKVLDRFELLPNATGAREITSPRAGYVSAVDAEGIGRAAAMIGGGRVDGNLAIDPAVGVILEVKVGQKVDAGGVLCRLYYTVDERVEEAAEMVEGAFRISANAPDERALILEVVG
jgi:pyrimidine-nucleoside phosphorylase/thymidine phosphorylase